MKTRRGFISNSSSSSFIVAAKNDKSFKCKMEIEVDLTDFQEQIIKTQEELQAYYFELYGAKTLKEFEEQAGPNMLGNYQRALKSLQEGNIILIGQVSSEDIDNPLEIYLYNNGLKQIKGNVELLQDAFN